MKVGVVELAFHNEVLRSYINILKDITDKIVCFTNQFCYDQIYDYQDDTSIDWKIKRSESNKTYFTDHHELLKQCDIVIIATLDDDIEFFSEYHWPTKTILLVHDYFSFFEPKQINYSGSIEEKARAAKSWLKFKTRSENRKINKLKGNMTKLAVPSTAVFDFVKERSNSPKLTEVLDFAVPKITNKKEDQDHTVICIPGNVIPKSRNYNAVLAAFKKINTKIDKAELIILGQAKTSYGRKIISELEKLQCDSLKLKYYNSFIHQKEFDEQISRSHFLLLPISKVMRYRHFKEMNGFTCVSGNINDMLYFGKPAILPKFYPVEKQVEQIIERYSDEDNLAEILQHWINDKHYSICQQKVEAVQNSLREQIKERFRKALS